MSRDQKPARMRVVAGSEPALPPERRAEDKVADASAATPPTTGPAHRKTRTLAALYVACCALGGAGVALLLRSFAS
jgi:hypothetical protein